MSPPDRIGFWGEPTPIPKRIGIDGKSREILRIYIIWILTGSHFIPICKWFLGPTLLVLICFLSLLFPCLQWSFLVPLIIIGRRYHIITQSAIYKWYISGIYCQLGDYHRSHLLREPETTILISLRVLALSGRCRQSVQASHSPREVTDKLTVKGSTQWNGDYTKLHGGFYRGLYRTRWYYKDYIRKYIVDGWNPAIASWGW